MPFNYDGRVCGEFEVREIQLMVPEYTIIEDLNKKGGFGTFKILISVLNEHHHGEGETRREHIIDAKDAAACYEWTIKGLVDGTLGTTRLADDPASGREAHLQVRLIHSSVVFTFHHPKLP